MDTKPEKRVNVKGRTRKVLQRAVNELDSFEKTTVEVRQGYGELANRERLVYVGIELAKILDASRFPDEIFGIVPVKDVGITRGLLIGVIESFSIHTLDFLENKVKTDPEWFRCFMSDILAGLQFVETNAIFDDDVKEV